uniref:G patch domain-containing protein 1 isoform X3 n=1 Tax=Geotrypetes seraphini TaxID=260995 RepID=A0A6P8RCT6_GEOSA|nr:G patch domain-containing protein 1 isoform X3 [Geotrypetes seraphini]
MAALGSDSDEEDFVNYGTPLEPLAEGESIKRPIPIQEQSVKDEKGRYKRFHGAFTGGFSAGYFNTVGSKEGWTPSTFISSRQGRADRQVLRPEDFMDEEDLGEHGIAPKEIMTTDDFTSKTKDRIKEKAKLLAAVTAPIPGASILEDLIAPANRLTIGVELLRKMGWKEGQGVGPRTKRKPCKQRPAPGVKVYGCALPPQGSEGSEDDDEYQPENVTFAPKDVMPIDFTIKDNVHGFGYKGLDPCQALFGMPEHINPFTNESKEMNNLLGDTGYSKGRKLGITGQAFGVGALEEEDADIYTTESMSKYDTVISEEDPGDGLFGWTAPKQYRNQKGLNKDVKYVGKILDGFSFASAPPSSCKIYPPPELPGDYRPFHYFRPVIAENIRNSQVLQSLLESSSGHQNDTAPQSRHGLSSSQRRDLLGEIALQGPTSVLELLSEKDRARIQEVKETMEQEQQQVKTKQVEQLALTSRFQPAAIDHTPHKHQIVGDKDMAATVTGEFQPFAKNPEKQKRYEDYLGNLKHGNKDALEQCLDPNMTEWERGREQDEFMRAEMLYRSSSSTLSSRFTRAKYEDDTEKMDVPRDQESDVSDKAAAVKMKMFGKLTRDQFEWHPEKLLCKRFNIPDPYPSSTIVGLPTVKRDKYSVFNFLSIPETPPSKASETQSENVHSGNNSNKPKKQSRWDVPAEDKKKDSISEFISLARSKTEVQMQQVGTSIDKGDIVEQVVTEAAGESTDHNEEEESRPPMDLFKAIFASSSDEKSSSSDENEEEEDNETMQSNAKSPETLERPIPDTTIANVEDKTATNEPVLPVPPPVMQTQEPDSEEFGPQLPPLFSSVSHLKLEAELSNPAEAPQKQKKNRDKSKNKREHKHKKEKKKKHKKHKHRSRHKKKSENNSSEDAADSSDIRSDTEEIAKLSPHELLKRLKHLPLP